MNNKIRLILVLILGAANLVVVSRAVADPRIDSWFTEKSGKYARLYETVASETAGNSVTTWSRGQGVQASPVYAGVREVSYSANWIYIRSSGLPSYTMGPWYLNTNKTTPFPSYPANTKVIYRFPRNPTAPVSKTLTGLGAIGYFVNGVALFDNRDAFYWSGTGEVQGSGLWNRDAYVNESVTFDAALAHQAGANHHYHANPIALRYQLGDHVDFNSTSNRYAESASAPAQHSPILAWVRDGYPIYGPYGYADPTNAASGIKRMVSGFIPRDGSYGSSNLTVTGRTTLPAWAARANNRSATLATNEYGPNVVPGGPNSATNYYAIGHYIEDNDYLGDLGVAKGTNTYDLDEYNGRFCVTPEFPEGTYAYFVTITTNAAPAYPYNLGRSYYGNPTGTNLTSIAEVVTTNFVGGANAELRVAPPVVSNNVVTLAWSATEGGTYQVTSSGDLNAWTTNATGVTATFNRGTNTTSASITNRFFRVTRTSLATYDTN